MSLYTLSPNVRKRPWFLQPFLDIAADLDHLRGISNPDWTNDFGKSKLADIADIAVDMVVAARPALFLLALAVAWFAWGPAITNVIARGLPQIGLPNPAPVVVPPVNVPSQPSTLTPTVVVPTATSTDTPTPVPPTPTPTVVPTETLVTLNLVNPYPAAPMSFNEITLSLDPDPSLSPVHFPPCEGVSRDYFLNVIIPALHLDPSTSWAYTGGGPTGEADSSGWNLFPWPTPASRRGIGYVVCKNEIFMVSWRSGDYVFFESLASAKDPHLRLVPTVP